VSQSRRSNQVFGRRNEPHTIIIAHGDHVRHFTVKPWLLTAVATVAVCFSVGYMMATSYLVFRDDLIGASIARQARMQHAYEDRISALRSQVDRIISRQLLDQQLMEEKVAQLMQRQGALIDRQSKLGPLLERANALGEDASTLPSALPVPTERPDKQARASALDTMTTASIAAVAAGTGTGYHAADQADLTFHEITQSLRTIETEQIAKLQRLVSDAQNTGDAVVAALEDADIAIDASAETGTGGPFIPADASFETAFEVTVGELDAALSRLDQIRGQLSKLPLQSPVAVPSVSSGFGYRKDPLLGSRAFHSGVDFRGPTGTAVLAVAEGRVISSGWNGGYGKMVELQHPDGLTTRYAHLNDIAVSEGQSVEIGDKIGEIGSTGRSTGPHLHYEIRKRDEALDPAVFLKTGRRIASMM
jgi:murein DD-endopeptidase MepM/ murein hydrolase activator NlpD